MLTQFGPTLTCFGGDIDHFNLVSTSSLQRDTKMLQEINFNKLSKNKPNFYLFPNLLPWTRDSNISLTKSVSQLYNLTLKREQILSLWFPKELHFWFPKTHPSYWQRLSFDVFSNPKNLFPKGTDPFSRAPSFGSPRFTPWSFEPHPITLHL